MADKDKEEKEYGQEEENSNEIDLVELAKKLWAKRKMILKWCGIGAVLGLIIAFSIPKSYTTDVKLAPELGDPKNATSKNLGALAAMAGLGNTAGTGDAYNPALYPDIVSSVPFNLSLLDIKLTDKEGKKKFTLEEYLENDVKKPWWSFITSAPGKLISLIMPKEEEVTVDDDGDGKKIIRLTEDQDKYIKYLSENAISTTVDEKTFVVTISVSMQDPVVSAILADSVASRLKEYVTDYRTNKARQDMYYVEKLNEEARQKYYEAQQKYANYLDSHQGIALYSAQTMRERLENEATLAFNLFNQTSGQLAMAKAKVQEVTPVYATIEPAAVPIKASAPRKVLILAGFIFLAFVAASAKILFYEPLKTQFKEEKKEEEGSKQEAP